MRISLAQQFVAATVTLTLAVLLATMILARWSFERGFAEYVSELERKRLSEVGTALLGSYDPVDGWKGLNRRTFDRALRTSTREDFAPPPRRNRPASNREPRPGGDSRRNGPRGGPPLGMAPLEPLVPTALFDEAGTLVMGVRFNAEARRGEILRYPIQWEGRTVGELRSILRRRLESPRETAFARQQLRASLIIFAAAVVLAVSMAMLLARRLLAPIRRAHGALGVIADGDYAQRLASTRSDELGELMRDIDALAKTLEDNQGARRRWIADISHELRTPVAILKGELEAIADGIRPFDEHQLSSLQAEVARIGKLIDDLYQLSLADLGGLRYEFEGLDLAALARDMVEEYARRFAADGLALTVDAPEACFVRGDRQRLEQLLRNLLENSRAYTNAPGTVEVTVAREGGVTLLVTDSAPGVPTQQCESLFDPLYRRDESRNRRRAGAGLGLAIARAVVDAHDGQISAEPAGLGGLAVRVILPELTGAEVQ